MSIPVQCCFFDQFWVLLFSSHCSFHLFLVMIRCQAGTSDTGNSADLPERVLETFTHLQPTADAGRAPGAAQVALDACVQGPESSPTSPQASIALSLLYDILILQRATLAFSMMSKQDFISFCLIALKILISRPIFTYGHGSSLFLISQW